MKLFSLLLVMLATVVMADNAVRYVVQINDSGETIPPNSIATPQQITNLSVAASSVHGTASGLAQSVERLATNLIVTSTVYVRSVSGIPFDPETQTVRIHSFDVIGNTVEIIGYVAQTPLVPLSLDWRMSVYASNTWENIAASVTEVAMPDGVTAAKAYKFVLPKPNINTAFFRLVDNSSGVAGSGLYWLVFGGIYVDGRKGLTATVDGQHQFVGGILVEPFGGP